MCAMVDALWSSGEGFRRISSKAIINWRSTSERQLTVVRMSALHLALSSSPSLVPFVPGSLRGGWSSHREPHNVWSILHLKPAQPQPLHRHLALLTGTQGDRWEEGSSLDGLFPTLAGSVSSSPGTRKWRAHGRKGKIPFGNSPGKGLGKEHLK